MKKQAASIFGKIFAKVLLGILVVLLVGVCAYQGVMRFTDYKINENLRKEKENGNEAEVIGAQEKMVSILYTKDSGSKKFGDAFLRMFDRETKEYQYVLIPAELSIDIDDITYQQICMENDNVPQTVVLKNIPKYYTDSEEQYKAADRILKAALGLNHLDFDENTTLESLVSIVNLIEPVEFQINKKMVFKNQDGINEVLRKGKQKLIGNQVVGMLQYTKGYQDPVVDRANLATKYWKEYFSSVADLDKKGIEHYYEEYYKYVNSADNYDIVEKFFKDMGKSTGDLVHVYLLPGTSSGDVYKMDMVGVSELMAGFESGAAVEEPEIPETEIPSDNDSSGITEPQTSTDVPDYSIKIINAALVEGVAGKWRDRLTEAGFHVVDVDTSTEQSGDTIIYINREGIGEELKEFFPNALFEVGYTGDVDIRIEVGLNYSE